MDIEPVETAVKATGEESTTEPAETAVKTTQSNVSSVVAEPSLTAIKECIFNESINVIEKHRKDTKIRWNFSKFCICCALLYHWKLNCQISSKLILVFFSGI